MEIYLSPKVAKKLKYFIGGVNGEISGLGKSRVDEEKDIIIEDVIILKQRCTGTTTDIEDSAQAEFLMELRKRKESPKDWNVWWHSHADMNVFWSSTDDDTITSHVGTMPFLISLVSNKKGEFKARLDVFPTDTSVFNIKVYHKTDDIKVNVMKDSKIQKQFDKLMEMQNELDNQFKELASLETDDPNIKKLCEKEIKDKIEKEKPAIITNYSYADGWKKGKQGKITDAIDSRFKDPAYNMYGCYDDDYYGGGYKEDQRYQACVKCIKDKCDEDCEILKI